MPNDHDLLIAIKTTQDLFVGDFRDFRKHNYSEMVAVGAKIELLEKTKLSVLDFEDQKKKVDQLQRGYWVAVTLLAVLQFLAPFIIKILFHI